MPRRCEARPFSVRKYARWHLLLAGAALAEDPGQRPADAPKYQAVLHFLDANPKWW